MTGKKEREKEKESKAPKNFARPQKLFCPCVTELLNKLERAVVVEM